MADNKHIQLEASQYGLEEVYSPSSHGIQAVANIIFVHGLFGGRKTWTAQSVEPSSHTFQQSSAVTGSSSRLDETSTKEPPITQSEPSSIFWPRDLLPQAIPDARVYTWNYDADVHHWTSSASQNTIHQHASNLLSDLAYLIAGEMPEPIIFVVHSLGGIVVKDALNQSSQTEGTRLKSVAPATYGVLFLGTPHRGSKSASMGRLAYNVTVAATRRPNLKLLHALERNSETLDRIGDSFRQTVLKFDFKLCSFREEKETRKYFFFNTMVVESDSAKIGDGKEEIGSIPENHRHMSKFASRSDIGFRRVSAILRTWTDDIKRSGKVHPIEGYQDCLASLKSAESRLRITEVAASDDETFQWLYDRDQVQFADWLQHDGADMTQIFWIRGKPGSGKSTLMKFAMDDTRTLEFLQSKSSLQWTFAGFFFHDRGSLAQKTFLAMLQGILSQLLEGIELLWPVVKPVFEELMKKQRTKLPSWDVNSLKSVLIAISQLRYLDLGILIFLDALDEHDGDNEQLTDLVWKLVNNSAGSRLKLKICLASRPWPVFTSSFSACPGFAIHDYTRDDIHIYTNRRLQEATVGLSMPQETNVYIRKLRDISEQVTDKARGVFIWVRLVVNELSKGLRDGTPLFVLEQKLSEMPSELKDLYIHTLRRIEVEYQQETQIMLQLALCSFSPLPLKSFLACSSYARWDSEYEFETEDTMMRHLASRSGGLLEVFSMPRLPAEQDIDGASIASYSSMPRLPAEQDIDEASIASSSALESILRVQFIHQTVKDFVAPGGVGSGFLSDVTTVYSGYLYLVKYGARDGASADEITKDMFSYAKAIERHNPQEVKLMATILDDIWTRTLLDSPRTELEKWIGLYIRGYSARSSYRAKIDDSSSKDAFLRLAVGANLVEYVQCMFDDKKCDGPPKPSWLPLTIGGPSLVPGQEDRLAMVKLLLKLGVSPHEKVHPPRLALAKRNAVTSKTEDLSDSYLRMRTVVSFILSRTYELAEESRFAIVKELLEHGANPNILVESGIKSYDDTNKLPCTAIEHCTLYESGDMIKLFLRYGGLGHGFILDRKHMMLQLLPLALLRRDIEVINAFQGYTIPTLPAWIEDNDDYQNVFELSRVNLAFAACGVLGAIAI
ncbi:hypothetical protein MMC11_003391 [Xylographa trunciseda]|nr:hypothetical protein [Xylographa trunciseda]